MPLLIVRRIPQEQTVEQQGTAARFVLQQVASAEQNDVRLLYHARNLFDVKTSNLGSVLRVVTGKNAYIVNISFH